VAAAQQPLRFADRSPQLNSMSVLNKTILANPRQVSPARAQ
jgi:hypothetical protein